MKNLLLITLSLLTIIACSKEKAEEIILIAPELENPSIIKLHCQSSMDEVYSKIENEYENDNLIKQTTFYFESLYSENTFEYNSDDQITFEVFLTDSRSTEKTYVYNAENLLINVLYKLNDIENGQIISFTEDEAPREYENGLMVKEWHTWGGFNTYEYDGDKLSKKTDHRTSGAPHHITTYHYENGLLSEEIKVTVTGNTLYSKTYHYDDQNRLIEIQDQGNVIELNTYADNQLTEKRENYFGIDPGFYPCDGNYFYTYEY